MSLIKQNRAFGRWDILFIAAGLMAAFWFFTSYASQDPRSAMETSLDRESATLKAAEILNQMGYTTGEFKSRADYLVRSSLSDSLQSRLSRPGAVRQLKSSEDKPVYPFYWRVLFYNEEGSDEVGYGPMDEESRFALWLNQQGQWIELRNAEDRLPAKKLNREALKYAFLEDGNRTIWNTLPDSAWEGVLGFDVDNGYDITHLEQEEGEKGDEQAHIFSVFEVQRLGEYYINNSSWDAGDFELSDIQLRTLNSQHAAVLTFQSRSGLLQQQVELEVTVLPGGTVISFNSNYNPDPDDSSQIPITALLSMVLFFVFGVIVLISFFLRMRARVVDTKTALVISILGGLTIPVVILLNNLEQINLFDGNVAWLEILGVALQMGIMGAIGSVGFFVFASIGDSASREHWEGKLASYDYIRQGMLFNRPVGVALLRSVVLMLFLSGFWSLLMWLFPQLYFDLNFTFLAYEAVWPPIYLLLNNGWFSLMVVLGIFMVAGSLTYSRSRNVWMFGLVTVGFFALTAPFSPLPISFGPPGMQVAVMAILGLLFVLIYLQWDFLTLLVSYFLFTGLIVVSSGWMVPSSPDLYIFVSYIVFIILITGWAVFSIVKGKEEQSLPRYVPEYVEELAQEQRIKQELQIARTVQQSFLPARKPNLEGLDIAAICKPAYETGGDYYDFIQLDERRIAVTIGDVSGKSIQAAFYMTFTKGILHSLCRETDSPGELLKKANRLFFDNARKGTFISLIYGIIDLEERTFVFARAGHNPILHLKGKTGEVKQLQPNGLGIGLTREIAFDNNIKEVKLNLADGDLLVLYTDGIVEALNEAHKFYGEKRLINLLKDQKERSSEEILDLITTDVSNFIGSSRQHDDMTVMVIKMNGRPVR